MFEKYKNDQEFYSLVGIQPKTFKKSKNNPLTKEKKEYNKFLSQVRIQVEHVFVRLKRFKILALRYRNKIRRFCLRFNLIFGIYNFELN